MCPRFPIFAAHAGCYRVRRDAVQSLARGSDSRESPTPSGRERVYPFGGPPFGEGRAGAGRPTDGILSG